jgi:hypothetical protein
MKSLVTVSLLAVAALQESPLSGTLKLYLLHDDKKNVWCGYRDEMQWHTAIEEVVATETASVEFEAGHPSVIKVSQEDDPSVGDWAAYETYKLNDVGQIISLVRTTNFLPNDAKRTEIFQRRNGKLVRTSLSIKSLTSGHLVVAPDISSLNFPLFQTASTLPFATLIKKSQETRNLDVGCVTQALSLDR